MLGARAGVLGDSADSEMLRTSLGRINLLAEYEHEVKLSEIVD